MVNGSHTHATFVFYINKFELWSNEQKIKRKKFKFLALIFDSIDSIFYGKFFRYISLLNSKRKENLLTY